MTVPSVWAIDLRGPTPRRVPLEAPHAVVSQWLDDDATHRAPVKAYAVSPPSAVEGGTRLLVRLLDDTRAVRLRESVTVGKAVRLGATWLEASAAPVPVTVTSWPELLTGGGPGLGPPWRWDVLTPATFRSGSRTSPFPAPETILRGLCARWDALAPAPMPVSPDDLARAVWVRDLHARTEVVRLAGRVVSGFVGSFTWDLDHDAEDLRPVIGALARFSVFAGIGSHTAFGLGTVTIGGAQ